MEKKHKVMRRFRIAEISAVDEPAQDGARARIAKARNVGFGCVVVQPTLAVKRMTKAEAKPKPKKVEMADLAGSDTELTDEEWELLAQAGVAELVRDQDKERNTKVKDQSDYTRKTFEQLSKSNGPRNAALMTAHRLANDSVKKKSSFMQKVEEIYRSDLAKSAKGGRRPSRTEAMQKARREYPTLFKLHQAHADQPDVRASRYSR